MNHKSAHILKDIADKFNNEYGAREIENFGIMVMLEDCAQHGQTSCSFKYSISGHAINYLMSLGYIVERKEGNIGFDVSFENAINTQL